MKFSSFGEKFSRDSGIVELMDDLGSALQENPEMIMMGGGNPGRVQAAETWFGAELQAILADDARRHRLFGLYQAPTGDVEFRVAVANYLKQRYGWPISEQNIAVSNGSQSAFFILFNLFAGQLPDGAHARIQFPLTPEYLGYADSGLEPGLFASIRPNIELMDNKLFKYRVNFDRLEPTSDIGAMCVSRPTNPTGNVLTDDEMLRLDALARERDIPFIVDGAYGLPFPNILFAPATPHWNENTILTLSLSKLGLPGVRTGIVVANESVIRAFGTANGVINLASGNLGPALATRLFSDGAMDELVNQHVNLFYREKARHAVDKLRSACQGLPIRIHKPEGAFFLWLWCEDLPIDCDALYRRLKKRGVLVVPGHHCFIGLEEEWQHSQQCIRVSYVQEPSTVDRGLEIIANELRSLYT